MPLRNGPALSGRVQSLLLPGFAIGSLILVAVWVGWALSIVPGGWSHITTGTVLLLAGFAGIALLQVFSAAIVVLVLESALYDSRRIIVGELLLILERVGSPPEPPHDTH